MKVRLIFYLSTEYSVTCLAEKERTFSYLSTFPLPKKLNISCCLNNAVRPLNVRSLLGNLAVKVPPTPRRPAAAECENAALFLSLSSTIIRHENAGALRKRFSNTRNLKTIALRTRNILKVSKDYCYILCYIIFGNCDL